MSQIRILPAPSAYKSQRSGYLTLALSLNWFLVYRPVVVAAHNQAKQVDRVGRRDLFQWDGNTQRLYPDVSRVQRGDQLRGCLLPV
jgi:hypothetical protein